MLRITIFAVGKLKERFWKDAVAEYLKRLGGYAKIEVRELPDSNAEKEASALLSALPERGPIILMDIRGKETSSEGLAQKIDNYALNSDSHISFIIGGSDGGGKHAQNHDQSTQQGQPLFHWGVPPLINKDFYLQTACAACINGNRRSVSP